ncbi:hypothetical protein D0T84_11825, partial [Dysgonomonas sp. 521]|uniref:hypothetical protein n=1 Tax=Dysgonomonas sp. 521 TaxID=2302932 RepID=UPI001C86FB81
WVDICRNGRFLEPISNGFRTGLLGGDAPDYASLSLLQPINTEGKINSTINNAFFIFILKIYVL